MITIILNTPNKISFKKSDPKEPWFNYDCSDENLLKQCDRPNDKIRRIQFADDGGIGNVLHVYFEEIINTNRSHLLHISMIPIWTTNKPMSYIELRSKHLVFKSYILKSFKKELYILTVLYPHSNSYAVTYIVEHYTPLEGMQDCFHKAINTFDSLEKATEFYNTLK